MARRTGCSQSRKVTDGSIQTPNHLFFASESSGARCAFHGRSPVSYLRHERAATEAFEGADDCLHRGHRCRGAASHPRCVHACSRLHVWQPRRRRPAGHRRGRRWRVDVFHRDSRRVLSRLRATSRRRSPISASMVHCNRARTRWQVACRLRTSRRRSPRALA